NGKNRHGGRADMTAGRGGMVLQRVQTLCDQLWLAATREPALTVVDHPLQRVVAFAPQERWRMRLLGWFGPAPDRLEVHVLTVKLSGILGPDLFHGAHLLAHFLEARLELSAVVCHLFGVPSPANAKEETSA